VLHYVRLGVFSAMVNSLGDKNRAAVGEYTSVRIPAPIKRQLEQAARASRKSLSAEIVARLAQSFDMAAPETDPGDVPASPTAREALALAKDNQLRTKAIEDALRAICSEDAYLDCLNGPAIDLLQRVLSTLPPKGT
jgi:Arc-like DNA binding domain